jgi:hypothetical protein
MIRSMMASDWNHARDTDEWLERGAIVVVYAIQPRIDGSGTGEGEGGLCVRYDRVGGWVQVAYPILLGRMHPEGHPAYPGMGSFFAVQVGTPLYFPRRVRGAACAGYEGLQGAAAAASPSTLACLSSPPRKRLPG